MLLGRRPLQSVLRFSKFQNFLCTKRGTTESVKFGPLPVYWQPTQTGNIKFFELKLGKKFVKYGIRTHAHFRVPDLKSGALDRSANLTWCFFYFQLHLFCQNINTDKRPGFYE